MERVQCRGTDPKTGKPCREVFFEVDASRRAEVLSRILVYCHRCKTVHKE